MSIRFAVPKVGMVEDGEEAIKVDLRFAIWKDISTGEHILRDFDGNEVDRGTLNVVQAAMKRLEEEEKEGAFFNNLGRQIIREMKQVYPRPILFLGHTGWGKSFIARHVARELGIGFNQFNSHPGMDMSVLVGMWRPIPIEGGVSVTWQDGIITDAARMGKIVLAEELTRAPQEAVSRLYGLLDTSHRSWSVPEGGFDIPVHDNFCMVATANPQGAGYYTQRLDPAMLNRFAAVFILNEPVADEAALAVGELGTDMADRILKFVRECRSGGKVTMPTRDLVLLMSNVKKGLPIQRAVELCLSAKYPDHIEGIKEIARLHFAKS
jgi:MoxR-like ATPase